MAHEIGTFRTFISVIGVFLLAGVSVAACSQDDADPALSDGTVDTTTVNDDQDAPTTTIAEPSSDESTTESSSDESTTESPSDESTIHDHFGQFGNVSTWEDGGYLRVASDGLANHNMMVGIVSWQQQVPIPQDYAGDNSWSIPLDPVLADEPLSTSDHFHKGAVAIAVNGIPMFNALNNRGEFAADVGELDEWGGHSGRADDYHYHLAPEHLEGVVGEGNPIAYALDGFPLFSQTTETLDEYLGRFVEDGAYQYHAVDYAPYFIAGFRGEVEINLASEAPEDEVSPQAHTTPLRGAYGPLAGAAITGFTRTADNGYSLEYEIEGQTYYVNYSWDPDGVFVFEFIDASGDSTIETYRRNER
ncbi:MAG: YHYH protein [Actinomycetia bacterium]|nr:YHYH protein [Actinomycetes bacterium]MCP4963403.1 YHYH protein [Actinomycetes bacterium]